MTIRTDILDQAAKVVTGDREDTYGGPEDSFNLIARYWSVFLDGRDFNSESLSPVDVALMMDLLKTARLQASPTHKDSWIDKAGYAACGAECAL